MHFEEDDGIAVCGMTVGFLQEWVIAWEKEQEYVTENVMIR